MKDLLVTSGLVGAFLPFAIALINQTHWKSGLKAIVAFACCVVAAFLTAWIQGELSTQDYVASLLVVFTLARASYAGLWRPTGAAPAVEETTTVKQSP